MVYVKWFFRIVAFVLVFGTLSYVLPRHDVARITGTEVIRMDFSSFNRTFYAQSDSGNVEGETRDVRLINTQKRKTWLFGFIPRDSYGVMVYRNEDTGWIWPPYFKFDSSDLQAEASNLQSTAADPQWVVITQYGWRNRFFTIYPNAIAIRPVDSPDDSPFPWFNVFFFVFIGVAALFIRAMWRQFRERSVDPAMERAGDAWDAADARIDERRGRVRKWLDSWKSKKRRY
ncbi:DUF1523 family protein [Psychromarinibacter halotolerans]|uniref:DUF1523 family protein n=1 Tax=Psychromarinibacter halotolerans TaxID=1775175 RepID=A0ABV7GVV0_9RHOB|nr:DUF1523 family protein [Psychromarinibacter halotolerans]MAQ85267.1 hypothetical protein [Maritimibacter sp.]MDF0596388.1 DUF1523 family protein [Psychromarinibacter halotolerans]